MFYNLLHNLIKSLNVKNRFESFQWHYRRSEETGFICINCMYMCMCMCMWVDVYAYAYMYMYMYVYMYMYNFPPRVDINTNFYLRT